MHALLRSEASVITLNVPAIDFVLTNTITKSVHILCVGGSPGEFDRLPFDHTFPAK